MPLKKWSGGFTLIEVIAVLVIIAIFMAAALPRVIPLSRWKLEGAARGMAGDLRLVRQESITSGQTCKAVFFIYTHRYQLHLAQKSQTVKLPEGISFHGSTTFPGAPPYIHFNALGRPSSGGTITLQSPDGKKLYVIVTPVTGRVRVCKTPPQNW